MDKKYLSKIIQNGTILHIKDIEAHEAISELRAYTDYLGVTTTEIANGDSTNPIVINGEDITAKKGNVVNYGPKEFIFNGSVWQEFGDLSALGELAYVDQASGSVVAAGSNSDSVVSFNGTADGDFVTGIATAAVAPSFIEGAFDAGSLPSLGAASTSTFATEGVVATYTEANETMTLSAANTTSAVISQGAFDAGTLPSKTADTFNAGSAATFRTAKAIVNIGTATAAGQVFTGSAVNVTVSAT